MGTPRWPRFFWDMGHDKKNVHVINDDPKVHVPLQRCLTGDGCAGNEVHDGAASAQSLNRLSSKVRRLNAMTHFRGPLPASDI